MVFSVYATVMTVIYLRACSVLLMLTNYPCSADLREKGNILTHSLIAPFTVFSRILYPLPSLI